MVVCAIMSSFHTYMMYVNYIVRKCAYVHEVYQKDMLLNFKRIPVYKCMFLNGCNT